MPDEGDESEPGDEITDQNREECQSEFSIIEAPAKVAFSWNTVRVHQGEGLNEHENQSITETTEQR